MTSGTTGSGPDHVTLRQILAYDEDGVLRLLLAPAGQDATVHGVIIGDEGAARPHDGRIVLAAGLPPDLTAAPAAVREAARRGAAAVVLREAEGVPVLDEALAAAEECGIALLARAAWADWGDTIALLRSATAFASAGRGDPLADSADGGLPALASATARQCRGSITVEDTQFRVLAHSATGPDADGVRRSTILSGRVPERRVAELRRSGLLRALWTSQDVIHRAADGDSPERLIVAVRSGGEMLGSLWAAADGQRLSPDAAQVLRRAAALAVPHLLRHRLRESGTVRREAYALRGLLHGNGDRRAHLWSLGLPPDTPCAVVVAVRGDTEGAGADRTLEALAIQATASRPTARALREQDQVAVLLPVSDDADDRREALALARELDALAAGIPDTAPVWIGAGQTVRSGLEASLSYEKALLVVRALREREARGRDPRPVRHAGPGDVGPTIDALNMLDAVRPVWEAGTGPVHELIRADLATGGDLVRSLAAYLETAGDVPQAARRLTLHPNTLRYRLRRVRERFDIDLDDPDTRLVLALAVRLTGVV
ncbi:CdaR family transcriptional regulator [Streptomyces sp. NBC_00059]|uniref:PucR family transcriptional regulator n=1 Tax=Streptomyces sp. NBC_00059 TaxID=2975635 RepID=UPI00225AE483|nr:helix-turn-helix domain-containing protein [Streptomyces sp. NBC_00059]MCX5415098.1 helix-turn-helix domain-containing protein [Streptomyces sp. NBC_00059]